MMELFILRHGHAEAYAPRDRDRELSTQGRQELQHVLEQSQTELQSAARILVSPYVRAQQTADVVAEYLPDIPRETLIHLTPDSDPTQLIDVLNTYCLKSILIVSHQPLVGDLLNSLCGFEAGRHPMDTAALAALDMEVLACNCAELRWLR